jgi:hypothetical protein
MAVVGACIADRQARNAGYILLKAADSIEICISTDFMCIAPFMSPDPALLWKTRVIWASNEKWEGWEEHYASEEAALLVCYLHELQQELLDRFLNSFNATTTSIFRRTESSEKTHHATHRKALTRQIHTFRKVTNIVLDLNGCRR